MLDRIVNGDGSDAVTMKTGLAQGLISRAEAKTLLTELYAHLLSHGVVVVDVALVNILCYRHGTDWRAVVIDGLGSRHPGFKLQARARVPALARIKLRSQWPLLEAALQRAQAQREV